MGARCPSRVATWRYRFKKPLSNVVMWNQATYVPRLEDISIQNLFYAQEHSDGYGQSGMGLWVQKARPRF